MNNLNYHGMPSFEGKTVEEVISLLIQHCRDSAENLVAINQEVEALKAEVEHWKEREK